MGDRGAGVLLQERQRDLAVHAAEDPKRPGPQAFKRDPQLVDQRWARTDEILPPASQRPDRLRRIRVGFHQPEAVMVGTRQLTEHERVKPIRLAARDPETITRRGT